MIQRAKSNHVFRRFYNWETLEYHNYDYMLRTRNDFLDPKLKFLPMQARRQPDLHKTASEMLPIWKDKNRIKSPIDYATLDQEQQISDEALMKGVEDGDIEFDTEKMDEDMSEWQRQQTGEVEFEDDEEDKAFKKKIKEDGDDEDLMLPRDL